MATSTERIAIFSDVHSNLEALDAVLEDMADQKITRRVCLGDVVGYGPDPVACLLRVRALSCLKILLGNHDYESARDGDLEHFRDVAQAGVFYSRSQLSPEQKIFIRNLPLVWSDGDYTVVHATLADPASWDYIMDTYDAEYHFNFQETRLCFCGHTHVPKIFEKGDEIREYPVKNTFKFKPGMSYLVNVGAVGQPRDLNKKACYAIYDPVANTVEHRRCNYDLKRTKDKILKAGLPEFLAQRLALGR